MPPTIPEFLRHALPEHAYDILRRASADWSEPIFARDPVTGRFECVLEPDFESDFESDFIDAACLACESLSDAGVDFSGDLAVCAGDDAAGEIAIEYPFSLEEADAYAIFQSRVQEMIAPGAGITAQFQKYPWGFAAVVRLHYLHDFDYQSKKDSID